VEENTQEQEILATCVSNILEEKMLKIYIAGLKTELRHGRLQNLMYAT
jgi:hypothetical protein